MRDIDYMIWELARPYLNTRHNDVHIKISCRFALKLLESEPGDHEVVIPAILCHDLGWSALAEEQQQKAFGPGFDEELRRVHELEGVKLARNVLDDVDYDREKTAEILEIIYGHDSRLSAISENDKLVKDADKLFRFHPVGLRIDFERFGVDQRSYTKWLLKGLDEWFFTATARLLAMDELVKASLEGGKNARARSENL